MRRALEAAAAGRAVFPLAGKAPAIPKREGGRGYKDASRDHATIHALFNRAGPVATGYGIATGQRSGVVVVDLDGPEAVAEAKRRGLTSGYVVKTVRGYHLYFLIPAGVEVASRDLAPGVEIKGEGCYVAGAGSVHPSGHRYTLVRDGEPSPAPLGIIAEPEGASRGRADSRDCPPVSVDVAGPPIPDGRRHDTLVKIAGRAHDGTRDLDALTRHMLAVNERCVPQKPAVEVKRIAADIFAKPPCKPGAAKATPEVAAMLDREIDPDIEDTEWPEEWRRQAKDSTRDTLIAMSRIARRRGEVFTGAVRAVRVEASVREIVEESALGSTRTVHNAIARARRVGKLRRDGTGSGPKGGAFLLLAPAQEETLTDSGGTDNPPPTASVSLCAPPWTAPRLRWSAPGQRRLGKTRGRIIDLYEIAGPLRDAQVAERIGYKRLRDLRHRYLDPLSEAGIIVTTGDGRRALSAEWCDALQRRRVEDGEIEAARLQKIRHKEQQAGFREAWAKGEVISRAEFARRQQNRDRIRPEERTPSGTYTDLERVPAPDPELVAALRAFLERNPRRGGEKPSWLAVALWAGDHVEGKPTAEAVEVALYELRSNHAA